MQKKIHFGILVLVLTALLVLGACKAEPLQLGTAQTSPRMEVPQPTPASSAKPVSAIKPTPTPKPKGENELNLPSGLKGWCDITALPKPIQGDVIGIAFTSDERIERVFIENVKDETWQAWQGAMERAGWQPDKHLTLEGKYVEAMEKRLDDVFSLTDDDMKWLGSLMETDIVYMQYKDGSIVQAMYNTKNLKMIFTKI